MSPKPKKQSAVETAVRERAATIDRYAEIRQIQRAWDLQAAPRLAELEALEAEILSWFDNCPVAASFTAEGGEYRLPVSARRIARKVINMKALAKALTPERFYKLCTVSLGTIEKELGADGVKRHLSVANSGKRSLGEPVRKMPVSGEATPRLAA